MTAIKFSIMFHNEHISKITILRDASFKELSDANFVPLLPITTSKLFFSVTNGLIGFSDLGVIVTTPVEMSILSFMFYHTKNKAQFA